MRLCNNPPTAECRAYPCRGCEPSDMSREEIKDAEAVCDFVFAAEIADDYEQQSREADEIIEWLGDPAPVQLVSSPFARDPFPCMNNADYDDLRNFAIGR